MEDQIFKEILNGIRDAINDLRDDQREIKSDVKEIKKIQNQQQITQAEQHITLVEHTKRSEANEKHVSLLEEKMNVELMPMKWKAKGAMALLGILFTVLTILSLLHRI